MKKYNNLWDKICTIENFKQAYYKNGGRFIAKKRWLFSFDKNDIVERVKYYTSGEYAAQKQYRYANHWVLWRERNGRF